ncbi:TcaA second domain-containing protein [Bacillus subtilis]|uniref:TcaA second domain-containing protein n=1 Tax=Bacillus subtilis TaxID=1423 RepID=A0AC62A0Y9_BACIU
MKRKKLLFVGVGIVAILVILFLIFGRSAKPSDLAKEFQEKVQSNDAKGLVELVKPENNQVSWNEKDAESIIKYLKDDNNDFDDQMQLLNAQASYYESDGKATNMISQEYPGESISNIGPFYITREKGLLGDKYLIKARGYKVEVKAAKGATVIFNGEKVDMNNKSSKVLGYYGLGVYKVKGQKKFEYTSVSDERNLTLFDPDDFEETANLDFSGDTVNIASSVPNTELMVNGKKTGKQVEEDSSFGQLKKE